MTGGALGATILPPLAEKLIAAAGWRNAFALLGALAMAVGLVVGTMVRERPGAAHRVQSAGAGSTVAEGLRSHIFWIIGTVLFFSSISQNGAIAHLAALLTDRGIPPARAALAMSALGGATLIGRVFTGWLLDRYFGPRVSFCLMAFAALGVFLLSGARSLGAGALGAALIGLGMGGEADITPYLLSRYFGLRSFSTLYGFTWTAYAIAGAIGPVIMGKAFDATGSYQLLLSRLALATFAAACLMLFLPRYRALGSTEDSTPVPLAALAGD
jgi:cyanate permease